MRGKVENGKLIFNIPLELEYEFEKNRDIIVNWRDDHSNTFTVILIDKPF